MPLQQNIRLIAGQEAVADFSMKRRMQLGEGCNGLIFLCTPWGERPRTVAEYHQLCVLSAVFAHKRPPSPPP